MPALSLAQLAACFPEAKLHQHFSIEITTVESLFLIEEEAPNALSWIGDKYVEAEKDQPRKIGLLLLTQSAYEAISHWPSNFLVVEKPRLAFAKVLETFFTKAKPEPKIEATSIISHTAKIGNGVYIGHHCIIEDDVVIEDGCTLLHYNYLQAGTIIRKGCTLGSHNILGHQGFGYEPDSQQIWQPMPHIGIVELSEGVTLHNHITIDRAVTGKTYIGSHCRIDNHVNIAHGVQIGANTLLMGGTTIAGSTVIGNNCWVAPGAVIINKISIGNDSVVGLGAVVQKSAPDNAKLIGNPAMNLNRMKTA